MGGGLGLQYESISCSSKNNEVYNWLRKCVKIELILRESAGFKNQVGFNER